MKVTGTSGPSRPSATRSSAAVSGFSLGTVERGQAPTSANAVGASAGVAGVSALMALQGVEDATERRRRAIRRGGGLLDRLEDLKLAMLAGQDGRAALERLSRGLSEARDSVEDTALAGLLDQIELRASVEIAKAERGTARQT